MMTMHTAAKRNHNSDTNAADDNDEKIPVPALTHAASSANAKGSGLENLTAVLMLQSSGGSEEEVRAAGCWSAAFCCSWSAAAAALLKWSEASSACRLKPLLNSCSNYRHR